MNALEPLELSTLVEQEKPEVELFQVRDDLERPCYGKDHVERSDPLLVACRPQLVGCGDDCGKNLESASSDRVWHGELY